MRLIVSNWILRRSTRTLCFDQSSSAMSVGVTEPKSQAVGPAVRDVGQQRHLTCTLDRDRDLALVPPARAGDAPRADLALLRDVAPQLVRVLVVDLGDLLLAEVTAALADRPGCAGTLAPRLPVAV